VQVSLDFCIKKKHNACTGLFLHDFDKPCKHNKNDGDCIIVITVAGYSL